MKRLFARALASVALLFASPALLVRCGGESLPGTETGNPPGVDALRLYLEVTNDGIRVLGSPGAVTPGGARVRVTNRTTGESVETVAGADGSLDVVIPGGAADTFEVTVVSGAAEVTQAVSFVDLATREDTNGPTCQSLESALGTRLRNSYDGADTSCSVDADCTRTGWEAATPGCARGCNGPLLSQTGAAQARAAAAQATLDVCLALEQCEREPPPPCEGPEYEIIRCDAGQCRADYPIELACDALVLATSQRRLALITGVDRSCQADADCTVTSSGIPCLNDCGPVDVALAASALPGLQAQLESEIDQNLCSLIEQRACPLPEPSCEPRDPGPFRGVCSAGRCELERIE